MSEPQELHFKTNVLLKSIIGKDLINDDDIAILELVKNAFDADAKKVSVDFKNIKKNDDKDVEQSEAKYTSNTSRIIVSDNGVGMSKDDIENKWLNIAYSDKKSKHKEHERLLAGAKGVGRFSCDRLGEYLNLFSRKKGDDSYIKLSIDWKEFEVEDDKDLVIQKIPVLFEYLTEKELKKFTHVEPFEHGTILEIIKLREKWSAKSKENWNTSKFSSLKKQLEKLINPNQAFIKDDFKISLFANEFKEENKELEEHQKFIGEIKNRIFERLDFKSTSIESEIIEGGDTILTTLKDKGKTVFWVKEKNRYSEFIKNAKVTLYYLNTYSKAFFTRQTGIRSVNYGSIFLFINGFRIPPYGEEGNDWLKIEIRKGQGYARFLSTRDLVGHIEILDRENKFQIISSREGIVKNEAYEHLTSRNESFFFDAFKRLERYVVDGLKWDSLPDSTNYLDIEKKVISGDFDESKMEFKESEEVKTRRTYGYIHKIINAKPKRVEELYINEDLIKQKVSEEKEQSEKEFEKLLKDFEEKKISPDVLEKILKKKALANKELEAQIKELSKYSTNEVTTKAILELQGYKKTIENQQSSIEKLRKQVELLEEETEEKGEEVKKLKEEVLFHKKLLTKDIQQLLEFHHTIGISSRTIEAHLVNLKDDLIEGKKVDKSDLFELVDSISFENNKIISVTNLATAANFKADSEEIETNLISFLQQYIENVSLGSVKQWDGSEMNIEFINESKTKEFAFIFRPIEIAMIIDNLISNSKKARADRTTLKVLDSDENVLEIEFSDNGKGIQKAHRNKLFEFGFTTTSGSGMGLYHVKNLMEELGNIELLETGTKGTTFILKFEK